MALIGNTMFVNKSIRGSKAPPSNLSYSTNPATYPEDTAITDNTPTVTGTVTSYTVNPALPTGLSIHATTGVISGTPTTPTAAANYTVTASNDAGSTTVDVNIAIDHSLMTGLISFWKLGEATGASRADSKGSNTLSDHNSVAQAAGKVGNCADFTSASSMYLDRSAQTWGFGNAWSVSVWYKQNAGAINRNIFQFGNNLAVPQANAFKMESDYIYIANSSGVVFKYWRNFATSSNWIHHVLTWDGTTLKLYRDGADFGGSVTKTTDNAGTMSDTSRLLLVGASTNGSVSEFFDGKIDAMGVWSRALTADEVTYLYNSGNGREHNFI